jgi:ATP-dependent DNA helicase
MAATSNFANEHMLNEEKRARAENTRVEAKRLAQVRNRRKKADLSPQERAAKAKELDELLRKSSIFGDILTQKTKALGRVGRDFDNQALTDAGVELKPQPEIMSGGTMRDYQLEGLTWMYEIMLQGMSGILADEMGLGMCPKINARTPELTSTRQDNTDYLIGSFAPGAGIVLWPPSDHRASQHSVELAR